MSARQLGLLLALSLAAPLSAWGVTVDFDDVAGSCVFADALPVLDDYAASGVSFARGGAVFDNGCVLFVDGASVPNVLAYNAGAGIRFASGEPGHGSDEMLFAVEMARVSFLAGVGGAPGVPELVGGTLVASAFAADGTLLDTASVSLGRTLAPIVLRGPGIARVEYGSIGQPSDLVGEGAFAIDDLRFVPVPEPSTLAQLALSLLAAALRRAAG